MTNVYEVYVEERFQGEVYGEALFRSWADATPDPTTARKLRFLEQLERETKEKLALELRALGRPATPDPARKKEGEEVAGQLAATPWLDLLPNFLAQLGPLIQEFEAAEQLAPPGKLPLLRQVTDHERALLLFAEREIEGGASDSLEPVRAMLEAPPD